MAFHRLRGYRFALEQFFFDRLTFRNGTYTHFMMLHDDPAGLKQAVGPALPIFGPVNSL